jgi:SAM-dependent methyltransferase
MDHSYNNDGASKAYRDFLSSVDGQIFRDTLGKTFLERVSVNLTPEQPARILDAGCGDGWLAGLLIDGYPHARVHACDAGAPLIEDAKNRFPNVEFTTCDLNKPLPYEQNFFDLICASMVIHDVEDELATLQLEDGRSLQAKLVIGADGANSWVRTQAGIAANPDPYLQKGVVANFACEKPHRGVARQWFFEDGILAWLPLPGNRMSMVWSTFDEKADALLQLSPEAFCERVAVAGDNTLGQLSLITPAVA